MRGGRIVRNAQGREQFRQYNRDCIMVGSWCWLIRLTNGKDRIMRDRMFSEDQFDSCECCGAPIYRPGLCGVCASVIDSVEVPLAISPRVEMKRVEVPGSRVLAPADLRD